MSYFKKARNYTKSSTSLDEKIAKANLEYEKTGVDSVELVEIANSTSGVYYAGIDHPEVPAVQSDVPDSDGFRSRDPSLPAENASDIDPSDPSTWETGGQGMDHLINPNDLPVIHGDNGIETQSTVKDQPILLTPDLTGFKGLRVDPNGDQNDMGQYGGMAYTYNLGVWGRTEGVIGPGNKFVSVLAAFGWPSGPGVPSGHPDYPDDRKMFGFYRYDDDATYNARLKMKALYANGLPSGSWKPVKCWMPFNSYGFGQTWTQYTSNPNNIWRANGDAYVQVHVFDGANQYNSSETVPPYTTVIFKDDIGKGENLPVGGLLGDLIGKLFGIGGSAAEDLAWLGGGKKEPKWPKPGTLSGNRVRTEAGLAQDGSYPGGPEAFYDKYGYTPQEAIDAYNNGGTPPDQSSIGGDDVGDIALNAGPSTPVRNYDGKFLPYMGGGRPGNVRPKGSAAFPQADASDWTPSSELGQVASAGDLSGLFGSSGSGSGSASRSGSTGDQLAFNWGKSSTPSTNKKLGHGADTNAVNYYNTDGEMGELPNGWTDQDLQDYLDNRGKGFPDQSSIDAGLPNQMVAALNNAQMPQYVKDSIKRQYKGGPDYSIEDKKNILNWQQKMKAEGGSDWTPSSGVQVASTNLSGLFGSSGTGSGSTGQLNLPSWFSGYGDAKNAKLDADGRIYGYNYSGGYGYLTKGPGSGAPGTAESGYGTKGFDWDTQSGGTSWTFTRHDPSKVASGEGGSPGQPYVPPKEDPKNPWVPAPGKKVAAGPGYIPPYVQDWEKLGGGGKNTGTHPWEKNKKNSKGGKIQASSGGGVGDVALNQGPSTPVKNYDGKFLPNMGGGRPGNIRPKGSAAFPQAKKDSTGRGGKGNNFGMGSAVVTKGKKKKKSQVVAASNEITGVCLNESNLLMEKNYLRDLREKKREKREVGDKVMKINITGPKDHLTVKAIDMLRQYKVSEREMQEYASIISDINQWIRENPKEYAIWKVRYPANDPRLAELNWRLDQQLKASDEYMDSHFPENERLFGKLRQKIATNVDITDPRNFVDVKPAVTHKQLLKVSKALEESNWKPLDSKVANKTTQTFGLIGDFGLEELGPDGNQVTANFGGLGGVESQPSQFEYKAQEGNSVTVSPPTYKSLSLAGYAKPLPWKMARKKNAKKAEEINTQLDSSESYTKEINADALMKARVEEAGKIYEREMKKWEAKKKSVDAYNDKLADKQEALMDKANKIWDAIHAKYYQGDDWSGKPYYSKTAEEMSKEYLSSGGAEIDAKLEALGKAFKDEPPLPDFPDVFDDNYWNDGLNSETNKVTPSKDPSSLEKLFTSLKAGFWQMGKITQSMLTNKQVHANPTSKQINEFAKIINKTQLSLIPVSQTPIPYSDSNFKEVNGKLVQHHGNSPDYTKNMAWGGEGSEIGDRGSAMLQIVTPKDGEPYILYTDHAYINTNNPDDATAFQDFGAEVVQAVSKSKPTGGMDGVYGDVKTEFSIPVSSLTKAQQQAVFLNHNFKKKKKIDESLFKKLGKKR